MHVIKFINSRIRIFANNNPPFWYPLYKPADADGMIVLGNLRWVRARQGANYQYGWALCWPQGDLISLDYDSDIRISASGSYITA